MSRFQSAYIRTRFLTVMIPLTVIPLVLLGFISFNIAKSTLIDKHVETNQDYLQSTNELAELMFENVIRLHRLILGNPSIQEELRLSAQSDLGEEGVISEGDQSFHIQRIMSQYFIDQNNISSVCLLDNRLRAVCYGRSNNIGRYEGKSYEIIDSDWYQKIVDADGKEIFFHYNVLEDTGDSIHTFSSVKLLLDPNNFPHQRLGILIVNLKKDMFAKMLPRGPNSNFIVQHDNNAKSPVFYSRSSTDIGDDIQSLEKLNDNGYLITRIRNQTTGWTFATAVAPDVFFKETNEISGLTITIVLVISIVSILLSLILSKSITQPLKKIRKMMLDWAKGKSTFDDKFSNDEIGTIANTFKTVSKENDELNKRVTALQVKEREAELQILQSQINPHFLYNTLDSIYWMAMIDGNDKIAQMSISLSESFKLALNRGKETMPIEKELEHIKHYINIQNIRYGDRFEFIKDIDHDLLDKDILKLLLQPLIENAVYHGIEPKVGKGTVKVTGRLIDNSAIFTVCDNGVGIKDMDRVNQGFGMRNVRERLKLYYGSASMFKVESEENKGTKITIRFPLKGGEDRA
ncbi:sensor histidine kinase [Aquibacillus albus]|nr:histidine kinase [Aquibacillus albus]